MSQTPKERLWNAVKSEQPTETNNERWEHIKQLLKQGYEEQQTAKELLLSLDAFGALADFAELRGGQIELREGLEIQDFFGLGRTICQIVYEAKEEHALKKLDALGSFEWLRLLSCGAVPAEELEDDERGLLEELGMRTSSIPAGAFWMGAKDDQDFARAQERPRHRVVLTRGFAMMKYAMTQVVYESVMHENPSQFKGASLPVDSPSWIEAMRCANSLSLKHDLTPVYAIDADDVHVDWEADGWRLPTEAEWEYAAQANEDFLFAGSNDIDEVCWQSGNTRSSTKAVGLKKPNGWDLYDMSGNVLEWCWDWSAGYSSEEQIDPKGPKEGLERIIRGGSWRSLGVSTRIAFRIQDQPSGENYLGFRLCRTLF